MQTTIGLFPKENGRFIDVIAKAAEEGLYDEMLEPQHSKARLNHIPEALSQNIGSIFEEIVVGNKDIDNLLAKSQRKHYNSRMWGEYYKRKEVNIIESTSDDEFTQQKAILSDTIIHSIDTDAEKHDPLEDFVNVDKLADLDYTIKDMRNLQEYFLIHERVDFRDLLINYFSQEPNPEGIEVLDNLIADYKYKIKDTLGDYLTFRQDRLIPDKYKDTLF